ncbi:MAG: alanine racemase [Actinomycetaceae bacterium]|nr:alanine racemase [Arcanobacterium sp.]MDD7686792.1 alanine racemase [Actinomycetaceae bacterium]MDY5272643.1 alanine racemase [Arcanobacterium sp.]
MGSGRHVRDVEVFHTHGQYPSRAVISRSAFEHNLSKARELAGTAEVMAVIKADAYGHGAVPIAQWAIAAGVHWFGIAQLAEAMDVRREIGDGPHILALIAEPGAPFSDAIELGIDLTVSSQAALDEIARAGAENGLAARVHLEVDTGMARGGVQLDQVESIAESLADYQDDGLVEVVGLWSHLACADEPDSPVTAHQVELFEQARSLLAQAGLNPPLVHLAASAGLLWHPQTHYTMVRPGIMLYGLSPNPHVATAHELGLEPVMQLDATVVSVRDVPQGTGVSYGHTAHTATATHLATVPLGYADGIPRAASNAAPVLANGERTPIMGRVCMDQFVIEAPNVCPGDVVTLFGGAPHMPTADEWAEKSGTIGYEIVTRIGVRVPREYADDAANGRK